ncbi:COX15/CtaA family protein [Pseudobdellovibrio sp. HCB154]|uniref:COX15/CtaA family protein n=1 Tax=Pseudobdellovibrio sp. HCB154 TaxID=3386277 RepID=UPI0039174A00
MDKKIRIWYVGLIALVLLMISVGGATRLTESGLSITEWKPVTGIIPPLTDKDWLEEFGKYKLTPQYLLVNFQMDLSQYKSIYYWEYGHRLLGRIIFLYVLLPGLFFLRRKKVSLFNFSILLTSIGFQGLMGWVMVKSGLIKEPQVSAYLLAVHYFLALALLVYTFYLLCAYREPIYFKKKSETEWLTPTVGIFLCLQIFYGCLMSGLRAGYMSDTFPLMSGQFVPEHLFDFAALFVHWTHRWLGVAVAVLITIYSISGLQRTVRNSRGPFIHLLGITLSQILLGIILVIFHVPKIGAVFHQVMAALIVLGFCNILFRSKMNESGFYEKN